MKHILSENAVKIVNEGMGIVNNEPVACPTMRKHPNMSEQAKYTPQSLPFAINGPFELEVTFPHLKNQYHTLDDVYVVYGQFESHKFHNKELFLPAKEKASESEDELFHGYTVQSFLTFVHSLTDGPVVLILLPTQEEKSDTEIKPEQGLVSTSCTIFLTWPDCVEAMTAFLMGLCWHLAGLTFGYYIRCPLARNPYKHEPYVKDENKLEPNIPLIEYQLNHLWVTVGLRGYLYLKYLKQVFGPSFVQFYSYKTIQMLLKIEESGYVPSIAEFYVKRLVGNKVTNNLDCITAHDYYVSKCTLVMNGLCKSIGEQAMDQFISTLLKKSNKLDKPSSCLYLHTLSTFDFISRLKKFTTFNFQSFLKQYIFYPGLPILNISYVYSKRKSCIEIDIQQTKTILGGPIFTGPLAVKIQEPDGSYEHVLDIQKQSQQFEVRYNTRYKRVKRFRAMDHDDVMFHRDINGIVVSEYLKPEDEAMEYVRVDCDHLWIAKINLKQTEYKIAQMVLKELDISTQMQGIHILQFSKEPSAATTLFRIICNHRYHPYIRSEACYALTHHHVIGMYYLLQYIKRFLCEHDNVDPFNSPHTLLNLPLFQHQGEIGVKLELQVRQPALYKYLYFTPLVLKSNEFSQFGQYAVHTVALQALSMIRIPNSQITLPAIRESSLGMSHIVQRLQTTQQLGQSLATDNPSHASQVSQMGQFQHQQLQQYHQQLNQQTMQVLEFPSITQGLSPLLIRKCVLDFLKCQDNTINCMSNDHFTATLLLSCYHAYFPTLPKQEQAVNGEELITTNGFMEVVMLVQHKLATESMDKHLFLKTVTHIDAIRQTTEHPLVLSYCILFISHAMLFEFIPLDLQRLLPYTLHPHSLVYLQTWQSLLLIGCTPSIMSLLYKSIPHQQGLCELFSNYCKLNPQAINHHELELVLQCTLTKHDRQLIDALLVYQQPIKPLKLKVKKPKHPLVLQLEQCNQLLNKKYTSIDQVTEYLSNESIVNEDLDPKVYHSAVQVCYQYTVQGTLEESFKQLQLKLHPPLPTEIAPIPAIPVAPTIPSTHIESTLLALWHLVHDHPHSICFRHPIDLQLYPDYTSLISHPMDLNQIYNELALGVVHFSQSMVLMFNNALIYNAIDSQVSQYAKELYHLFAMEFKLYYPSIPLASLTTTTRAITSVPAIPTASTVPINTAVSTPTGIEPTKVQLDTTLNSISCHPLLVKQLLSRVKQQVDVAFHTPVPKEFTHYYSIITSPMDLHTIQHTSYTTYKPLIRDLQLIIQNCFTYNLPHTHLYHSGLKLLKVIEHELNLVTLVHQHGLSFSPLVYPLVHQFITKLMNRKQSQLFIEPVDPIKLNIPHYTTIVKHPMSLQQVLTKLNSKEYTILDELQQDVLLIKENCILFNGQQHSISLVSKQFYSLFEKEYSSVLMAIGQLLFKVEQTSTSVLEKHSIHLNVTMSIWEYRETLSIQELEKVDAVLLTISK